MGTTAAWSLGPLRSFPIVYARSWAAVVAFYERLGFERTFETGEYATLTRGDSQLGVVSSDWPAQHYGLPMGDGVRFELFVYVEDVRGLYGQLVGGGVRSIRPPEAMPWGETVAFVADPEGNPVALAMPTSSTE